MPRCVWRRSHSAVPSSSGSGAFSLTTNNGHLRSAAPDAKCCLYFASDLQRAGCLADACLAEMTERHHAEFAAPPLQPVADPGAELLRSSVSAAVFELKSGLPSDHHLRLISRVLETGRRAWVYWPAEEAVEGVDRERLR